MNNSVLVTGVMATILISVTGCGTTMSEKENEARIQKELEEYKIYHLIDYGVERDCWQTISQKEIKTKKRYATNAKLSKYSECIENVRNK